jgi:hypothetical protein
MDMEEPTIRCKDCKQYLPLTRFYKDPSKRFGYDNRCKSCETVRQSEKSKSKKNLVQELKAKPCTDCGKEYPYYVMQFDHRPGEEKLFVLSNWMRPTKDALRAEAAKCDVVCTNCHLVRTYVRREASKV